MRHWPSLQEYNKDLAPPFLAQNIQVSGLDLTGIQTNAFGIPNALSGGFAYIYQLTIKNGSRRALRLFHSVPEDRMVSLRNSYNIVQRIRNGNSPLRDFFVDAFWVDDCLASPSGTVPAIIMDWVEAPMLASWLEKNHDKPEAIRCLRSELQKLLQALESSSILHGDLQANNIAVASNWRLILLDYDNVCPIDEYQGGWEAGHIHFQHPDRVRNQRAVDRFPLLVMDLGLAILEAAPHLFSKYCQGENVLFTADDFLQPRTSPLVQEVASIPGMERACALFVAICEGPADAVPSIDEFHEAARLGTWAAGQPKTFVGQVPVGLASAEHAEHRRTKKHQPYRPVYPVYHSDHFLALPDTQSSLVGQKIELVGLITEIKESYTKYNKPYVFVNFNNWRRGGIKLIFWSEGLEVFGDKAPDESWEGRWISATGMVDEPYRKKIYGNLSYSITITDPSQVRLISPAEAQRRIECQSPKQAVPAVGQEPTLMTGGTNVPVISSLITNRPGTDMGIKLGTANKEAPEIRNLPSNAELLRRLSSTPTALSRSAGTSPTRSAGYFSSTPGTTSNVANKPSRSGTEQPIKEKSSCLIWLFIALSFLMYWILLSL